MDKASLITGLVTLQTDMEGRSQNSKQEYATRMANLLEAFVKSAKVQPGIHVETAGSAASQTGATTTEGTLL